MAKVYKRRLRMATRAKKLAPPARRRNAGITREAILASARQAFAQVGYEGAGVREIAEGVGVTAMLVNRYFGSKELLFAEVNGHGALLRFEPPRQVRRDVAVERNRHSLIRGGSRVGVRPLRRPSISGCATECAVQFRRIGHQGGHHAEHDEARQENIQVFPVARLHFNFSPGRPPASAVI